MNQLLLLSIWLYDEPVVDLDVSEPFTCAANRVYPVMENLEKSWNFIIFSRPGKVMEIDSRFWKIHKKSWKLKGILS